MFSFKLFLGKHLEDNVMVGPCGNLYLYHNVKIVIIILSTEGFHIVDTPPLNFAFEKG
jgi:hypothetical protein